MAMEVLLMTDVPGLGAEGDVVKVADGYARNYLLPRSLAAPVTEAMRRKLEKNRKQREVQETETLSGARAFAARIEAASCTIAVKTGEENKMFGSVTAANIAETLAAQGLAVDRHQIQLADPIRELGVYNIDLKIHPKVTATLKVWVVEE